VGVNATYLVRFDRQLTANAPARNVANTAENPVRLRLRATTAWNRNGWSAVAAMNHTGSYDDDLAAIPTDIASWTTFDLVIGYSAPAQSRGTWLEGVDIFASAHNLFDRDPPHFGNQIIGVGFDATNADPIGRVISLNLKKAW